MHKTIYRTVIRYEVLSETPIPDNMTMGDIERECDEGEYSGKFLDNEATNEPLTGKVAADKVKEHGTDTEFFNMDAEGNDIDAD
jgi:hypothetical protein